MDEAIIREMGGGVAGLLVAMLVVAIGVMALVIRSLWSTIQRERERTSEIQSSCGKDLRELQISTLRSLNDVEKSVTALSVAIQVRRREDDR